MLDSRQNTRHNARLAPKRYQDRVTATQRGGSSRIENQAKSGGSVSRNHGSAFRTNLRRSIIPNDILPRCAVLPYTYDAFNRRILKNTGDKVYRYAYDDWNIVAEYVTERTTTTHTNYIDTGMDGHLAMVPNGDIADIEYFLTDERGNVVALVSASGTILERYRYTVYGKPTIMDENFDTKSTDESMSPFLWGGSYMDNETGLYWMRNRYYHIGMKRFINQDPIGIWGDANNLGNGFAYVAGMVVEHADPTGLDEISRQVYWQHFSAQKAKGASTEDAMTSAADVAEGANIYVDGVLSGKPGFIEASPSLFALPGKINSALKLFGEKKGVDGPIGIDKVFWVNPPIYPDSWKFVVRFTDKSTVEVERQGDYIFVTEKDCLGNNKKLTVYNLAGEVVDEYVWDPDLYGKGKGGWKKIKGTGMPSDPDNAMDAAQSFFASQAIKQILGPRGKERKEHDEPGDIEEWEKDPIIPHRGEDGSIQFIHNPFYREQDLLFQLFIDYEDSDGKKHTILNPFRAKEKVTPGTHAQQLFNSSFNPGNIDPWFD